LKGEAAVGKLRTAFAGVLLMAVLAAAAAAADVRPAAEQAKIDDLLIGIQKSDAVFIRNGKEYDGEQAAAHLKTKLWWAGSRVQTARDFIKGVATHSEESGKPYEIRFADGHSRPLADWLLDRLAEREKSPPK
jgi:hypothetical protein